VDQRGAGKSTPFGEIKNNTTPDLIADFEKIRNLLNVNKWQVFGGSWGLNPVVGIRNETSHSCF